MDIDYLCELSHIKLNEKEKNIISQDIQKIIGFFDKLQELNIQTEEYYYPQHLGETKYNQNIINEINFKSFLDKNSFNEGNYFKIPPILKN
ncbi:MAG: aspartyl/glutamyl-tRNA amidotransferase subunit C [bacterium]|nr:aspartyl/glutamyl-tRNA amidotransferase subunit C [bacterium]